MLFGDGKGDVVIMVFVGENEDLSLIGAEMEVRTEVVRFLSFFLFFSKGDEGSWKPSGE